MVVVGGATEALEWPYAWPICLGVISSMSHREGEVELELGETILSNVLELLAYLKGIGSIVRFLIQHHRSISFLKVHFLVLPFLLFVVTPLRIFVVSTNNSFSSGLPSRAADRRVAKYTTCGVVQWYPFILSLNLVWHSN